jgi:hypothetical protein
MVEEEDGVFLNINRELIDFIIKYDYVEHVIPIIPIPTYIAVVTENDILIVPEEEEMDLWIGHLHYVLTFSSQTFEDIVPASKTVPWILPAGIGVVLGVGITVVIVLLVK